MRVSILTFFALLQALTVVSVSVPELQQRDASDLNELFKRKGGGGGGKGGGGGVSSGGSSGSIGSSGGGARTGSGSNAGGATSAGSGTPRSYGGGSYYSGGASRPFTAGTTSPRGLTSRGFLPIAALGFFGGAWLYGAYLYSYPHPYTFYNATAGQNQTKPVDCLCQEYGVCGCDTQDDDSFLNDVVGNGSYAALDKDVVRVADVNGTSTIVLNGTVENGTTASGGQDDVSAGVGMGAQNMGWLVFASAVTCAMWIL